MNDSTRRASYEMSLNAAEAKMLLELVTRAAAPGPEAATLGTLFVKAQAAHKFYTDSSV